MNKISKLFALTLCSLAVVVAVYKFRGSHVSLRDTLANATIDSSSQVLESNSIEDVKKFIEPNTLFIFDYDNVLVEGKEDYGFDAWFCAMFAELEKKGLSSAETMAKLLPVYEGIQRSAQVQAVEPCTKSLIEGLKSDGQKVMILTVRSLSLIECVFHQLKSVGIDIGHGAIPESDINSTLSKLGSRYFNGILFCAGYYKGPALKAFLQGHPELNVKKIVFVDDKLKNIESVKTAAQELGVRFVGIRYGHTDARVKAYHLDEKSLKLIESLTGGDKAKDETATPQELPSAA